METATELRKTANLCGDCTRAFKHENYRLKFHSSGPLRSVLETAASGCPVCVLVQETIRQAGPHWWNDLRYRISPETRLAVWGQGAAVRTASPDSSTREPTDPFHISIFERNEDFAQLDLFRIKEERRAATAERPSLLQSILPSLDFLLPSGAPIPQGTYSDDSLAWIKDQIYSCMTEHVPENPLFYKEDSATFPTRVLDIGYEFPSTSTRWAIRLWEPDPSAPPVKTPYLCLSYCWGKEPFLRTLSTNVTAHKLDIPWTSLPETFRDALDLTRRLGHRYLWIDSLCIIQDDEEDWKREAQKMGDIFESAFLVISAAKSSSAHEGMYTTGLAVQRRGQEIHVPIDLSDRPRGGIGVKRVPSGIFFRPHIIHLKKSDNNFHHPYRFPTLKRGWILQERLLSRRILHFGPEELIWECSRGRTCQCKPQSWGRADLNLSPRPTRYSHGHQMNNTPYGCHYLWTRVIQEYTRMNLTQEKDIFPAISGLVKRFQPKIESKYVAGLWESNLSVTLLWTADTPRLEGRRPTQWRAPTWSWASLKSTLITFKDPYRSSTCDILDVVCLPAGTDPTGELVPWGSHLTIRGRLISTTLRFEPTRVSSYFNPTRIDPAVDVFSDYDTSIWLDDDYFLRWFRADGQNSPAPFPHHERPSGQHTAMEGSAGPPCQNSVVGDKVYPVYLILFAPNSSVQRGEKLPPTLYYFILRRLHDEEIKLVHQTEAAGGQDGTSEPYLSTNQHQYVREGLFIVRHPPQQDFPDDVVDLLGEETVVTIF